jgi:hypothetical protein
MASIWSIVSGSILSPSACFGAPRDREPAQRSPRCIGSLEGVPNLGSLLFRSRGYIDRPFQGFGVSKIELDRCGVLNFTHHDLRLTFASNLAALGVRLEVTEKLLNQVSGSTDGIVGVYQRYDFQKEMREAIVTWETRLDHLLKALPKAASLRRTS